MRRPLRRRRPRRLFRSLAGRGVRRHGSLGLRQVDPRTNAHSADRADRRPDRSQDTTSRPPVRAAARFAPQLRIHGLSAFRPLAHRRVIDNVAFGLEVKGWESPNASPEREVLKLVGRGHAANQFRTALRRHAAARRRRRAFVVGNPQVMLYDEPFSALDPLIRRDMQDEVCRLQRRRARPWSSSRTTWPRRLRLGDRIAIMRDGGIAARHAGGDRGSAGERLRGQLRPRRSEEPRAHSSVGNARVEPGTRRTGRGSTFRRRCEMRSPWLPRASSRAALSKTEASSGSSIAMRC